MAEAKFWMIPAWLRLRRDISWVAKALWCAVKDRMGTNEWAWAGMRRLSRDLGVTLARVRRATLELVNAIPPLLKIIIRGKGKTAMYQALTPTKTPLFDELAERAADDTLLNKKCAPGDTSTVRPVKHNHTHEPEGADRTALRRSSPQRLSTSDAIGTFMDAVTKAVASR